MRNRISIALFFLSISLLYSNPGKLLLVCDEWPPYEFSEFDSGGKKTGRIIGTNVEIISEVLKRLGVEVEFSINSWKMAKAMVGLPDFSGLPTNISNSQFNNQVLKKINDPNDKVFLLKYYKNDTKSASYKLISPDVKNDEERLLRIFGAIGYGVDSKFGLSADGIFSLNKNFEREQYLYYPNESLTISESVLFCLKSNISKYRYESFEDLNGLKIGLSDGYDVSGGLLQYSGIQIARSPDNSTVLRILLGGRIDLWPVDKSVGFFIAKSQNATEQISFLPTPLNSSSVFIAFAKKPGLEKFAGEFSKTLMMFKQEKAYQEIFNKYLR